MKGSLILKYFTECWVSVQSKSVAKYVFCFIFAPTFLHAEPSGSDATAKMGNLHSQFFGSCRVLLSSYFCPSQKKTTFIHRLDLNLRCSPFFKLFLLGIEGQLCDSWLKLFNLKQT